MTTTKSQPKLRAEDVLDTVTGYDEEKAAAKFGASPVDLDGTKFLRALVFVQAIHDGAKDADAFKTAQGLTIAQLKERFVPDDEDPDLPGAESGKDED